MIAHLLIDQIALLQLFESKIVLNTFKKLEIRVRFDKTVLETFKKLEIGDRFGKTLLKLGL